MKTRNAVAAIYGSVIASVGTVVVALLNLALLEGSAEADGPGVGIGLLVVTTAMLGISAMFALFGTALLATIAWRAKQWPKGTELQALLLGTVCTVSAIIVALVVAR